MSSAAAPTIEPDSRKTWLPASMLLDDAVPAGDTDRFWIARDGDGLIVAAAAVSVSWVAKPVPGPSCHICVVAAARRRGLGGVLADRCINEAKANGAAAVYSAGAFKPGSEAAEAAVSLGFDRSILAESWRLDVRLVRDECERLIGRASARGRTANLESYSLAEASASVIGDIVRLQTQEVGGSASDLMARLRAGPAGFDPGISVYLTDATGRLAGLGLVVAPVNCAARPHATTLESIVIAPVHRGGMAVAVLKHAIAERYMARGGQTFKFVTLDAHRDTRRQVERLGPVEHELLVRPYRLLEPSSSGTTRPISPS